MLGLLLTILRYLFLLLLYVFIVYIVKMMFSGLQRESGDNEAAGYKNSGGKGTDRGINEGAGDIRSLPPNRNQAQLMVLGSADPELKNGALFPLGDSSVLGRGRGCDIPFGEPFASHEHARIVHRTGQYWLEDMGSTNGTYLNDVRLGQPTVLADGDRIRIGDTIFQFMRWAYEMESSNEYRSG